ncbi:MAG: SprT family protein [Kurthia sp.]|nr:SprT family protein [Candidatus Kurthia equi]
MTDEQLTEWVKATSENYFNKPFIHKAFFNNRLRTTGGRYLLKTHNIEINPKYLKQLGEAEVTGIIKHELCHYHLHIEGKGYKHGDRDFKALLRITGAPRYCSSLEETKHVYICMKCGLEYKRKRRINTDKYRCSKCLGLILKKH